LISPTRQKRLHITEEEFRYMPL